MLSTILETLVLTLVAMLPQQEPLGEYWGTGEEEAKYYKLVDVPLPEELAIEAGSFEVMPDKQKLAIATRRGDIFFVEGAFDEHPQPVFNKFASGLDEVMGMAYRDGSFYVTQQTEVTRISDVNHDGRADRFETLSDDWGFRHYHEFAFGSKPDSDGNIWVALCLSKSYHSDAPFRGWCLKITPEGKTIPVCSGIRSPCGIGPNEHGVMFYSESQGPWNGSCSLKVLQPGGFMGHPISFNWYELAPEMGPAPVKPNTPSRLETERKRVKELVPYAVVFPYKRMGRSISGFMVDRTGGKFGPFENQIFVADFSLGVIMRTTTEKVNGVWQGACYPFREGFNTGLLAVQFTPQGSLIAGGTNRGWPVRGPKAYAVQRLDWTGVVPFEIKEIKATPTGFDIEFTKPVDSKLASLPATYQLKTFTHIYQQGYGSPEVDQTTPTTTEAVVSKDGLKVQITVDGLVQGHVHDFHLPAMKSADGEKLLHASAYYTLNEIPKNVDKAKKQAEKQAQQRIRKRLQATDRANAGITHGVIDFQRPEDAVQLVGPCGSVFVPEKPNPRHPWTFENGILTASPKWASVVTPELYRDFRMHVEFNVNDAGDVPIEKNGNSGVYLQKRYELQILNSFGISEEDYTASYCGSLYRQKKPDQLVNKPAGQWQSFDIAFRAARFEGRQKTENARITVYQNGKLIHDDYPLKRQTGVGKREQPIALPIKLQGHHNQVRFRNIWIQRLNLDQPPSQTVSKGLASQPTQRQNDRPNIVVILADDLGYGDVGCFNPESKIPTPHLDRMAQQGMRFTDAHSPCTVCTPTRYSLMTGQMAFRIPKGGRVFTGAGGPSLIASDRLTLPQMLRDKGFATACFGKWHIGMTFEDVAGQPIHKGGLEAVKRIDYSRPIKGGPLDFGFDQFYGTACCPTTDWLYAYIDGNRIPVPPTKQLDKSGLPKHPYANDNRPGMVAPDFDLEEVDMVFLEKSQQFLKQHVADHPDKPFFLFHSAQAVHLPSFPGREFKGKTESGPHGDFIFQLDHIVGELMKTLKQLNVDDNTLVIFASDNGPEVPTIYHMRRDHQHDGARPWRGVKRDNWEGGHRIPMIVHWPGKVAANSESTQITSLTDVMATVAEIVDAEIPDNAAEDSFSMLPAMLGTDEGKPIRPYILQQGFGGKRYLAIRRGKWKYLAHKGSGGNNYNNHRLLKEYQLPDTAPEAEGQLFNLETDPGETENLALNRADIAGELRNLLKESMASGRSRPILQRR